LSIHLGQIPIRSTSWSETSPFPRSYPSRCEPPRNIRVCASELTSSAGCLTSFIWPWRPGDRNDSAFHGDLRVGGYPAGVGDGVINQDSFVGGAKHVEVGQGGGDTFELTLGLFIQPARWLSISPAAAQSSSVGMGRWPGLPSTSRWAAGLRLRPGIGS
jgi:hypothetical protein